MYHFYVRISFIFGVLLGIFLAVFIEHININRPRIKRDTFKYALNDYQQWFKNQKLERKLVSFDKFRYGKSNLTLESDYLYERINILCIILVKQIRNIEAIKNTWGKSCSAVEFVNLVKEKSKKVVIKSNNRESTSWTLFCKSLFRVPEETNWIVVVYDNTFVIVENLRFFIASLNPLGSYYFGHPVSLWSTVYNLGQAGYVFSKGALNKFRNKLNSSEGCAHRLLYNNKEDYYLGKYFATLNITPADTRDHEGLSTFHPLNWYNLFSPSESQYKYSIYPVKCCSKYSVTFQSIESDKMYTYYYLLYRLQIFHDGHLGNRPRAAENDNEVWKQFLRERDLPLNISAERYYKIWVDLVDDPTSFAKHLRKRPFFDYN